MGILNLFLIPILLLMVSGKRKRLFFAWAVFACASIVLYFLRLLSGAACAQICSYGIFLIIPWQKILSSEEKKIQDDKASAEAKLAELKQKTDTLEKTNAKLEEDVFEYSLRYELTKKMSACLQLQDILKILGNDLSRSFKFEHAYFFLPNLHQPGSTLGEIFAISSSGQIELLKECPQAEISLWQYSFEKNKPFFMTRHSSEAGEKILSLLGCQTLLGAPLILDGEFFAALCLINAAAEQEEHFSVLVNQLTLQIKKIRLYEKIQELAITDGLTALFVRRYFLERLKEEINRSKRHRLTLSLLMLDLDFFKNCNDEYGHLVGDAVLRETAQIIKSNVREIDLVGRLGGEEFCVGLLETAKENAILVAERIRKAVAEHRFQVYDETIRISLSIGLAVYPEDANSANLLIDTADEVLYQAKKYGRNQVRAY
jgi:diguanylate cyclase (GGDEF)-like protein